MPSQSRSPLVTVYIPCHDYGRYLSQAVQSVLSQLHSCWELFIVDDASCDETASVAEGFRALDPERIRLITCAERVGLQKIANRVLAVAKGEYIVRLDADDWLDEAALLVLVARASQADTPAVVCGGYYYVTEDGKVVGVERQLDLWGDDHREIDPPHGACTLVRTRSLRAVGGYSEDIDAQDGWELWFKLVDRVNCASVSTPVFYYRQHSGSVSSSGERLYNARAKIFSRLRDNLRGSYVPSVLAVIPVRESYPHFEGVPYARLGDKTILERALAEAQMVSDITEVLVSADSQAVVDHASELVASGRVGEHMRVVRPPRLNGDHIHLLKILSHAGELFRERRGAPPDVVLFLSLHAVLRTATSMAQALDVLLVTQTDSVVSVVEERSPIFVHSKQGLRLVGNGRFDNLVHKSEQLLRFNGSVIATWWDVIEQGSLWGGRTGFIEMMTDESLVLSDPSAVPRFEELLEQRLQSRH